MSNLSHLAKAADVASIMQASPSEFHRGAQQQRFVDVPVVTHILREQPVTFKKYETVVTHKKVPVTEEYKKIIMNAKSEGQPAQAMQFARDVERVADFNGGVSPNCSRGAFQSVGGLDSHGANYCPTNNCTKGPFYSMGNGGDSGGDGSGSAEIGNQASAYIYASMPTANSYASINSAGPAAYGKCNSASYANASGQGGCTTGQSYAYAPYSTAATCGPPSVNDNYQSSVLSAFQPSQSARGDLRPLGLFAPRPGFPTSYASLT